MKQSINLQDAFLNKVRKENTPITVYLSNGYQLKGNVKGFDSYVILLENEGKQQIVYKHAILTIHPSSPVEFI
ncbi:RNA-binding protein Hfq [Andreesenia angusta]|uniref:RNA-binding protein Hfq n=1 Tax=Andreesenia angusta TaxID=39480 RepID=A0A1S1V8X2_9FIRM|nr:RNA chaperone Hfq [Andreesenia angusta]OHW62855.1 RNA-binding protein Hfq [Andreesenia angusta]